MEKIKTNKRIIISAILVIASVSLIVYDQIYLAYYSALIFSLMNYFNLRYKNQDLISNKQSISILMLGTLSFTLLASITYFDLHISDFSYRKVQIMIILILIQILFYVISTFSVFIYTWNQKTINKKEYIYFIVNTIILIWISVLAYSQLFDYLEFIFLKLF